MSIVQSAFTLDELRALEDQLQSADFTTHRVSNDREYVLKVKHTKGYPKFDSIPVMTITMLAYFNGDITEFDKQALQKINYLLPVSRLAVKPPSRLVKKFVLTYPGAPWLILTTNLDGKIRGRIKTSKKGSWPNSIMIDMSVPHKLINFKLSPDNIHMTGCKTVEMGMHASMGLLNYVNIINKCLKLIQNDVATARRIADEIIDECTNFSEFVDAEPADGNKYVYFDASRVAVHEEDSKDESTVRTFISMAVGDLNRYDQVVIKIDWMLEQTPIFDEDFYIDHWRVELVKYRFSIGFEVDRPKLTNMVYTHFSDEFFVDYHQMLQNYVRMEILDPHAGVKCKENAKHTFSVQANGNVTYNSTHVANSKAIYNLFISTIDEIRSEIEVTKSIGYDERETTPIGYD